MTASGIRQDAGVPMYPVGLGASGTVRAELRRPPTSRHDGVS